MLNDGLWHHVAAVYDGVHQELRVYVDHVLAGETGDTTTTPPTNAQPLVVGAFNAGSQQFEGEMDFVRVSSGALAPAEFVQPTLAIVDVTPTNGATFLAASNGLRFTVVSEHGVNPDGSIDPQRKQPFRRTGHCRLAQPS